MKKFVSRALIVIVALGLLLALIVFGVNAARRLARSGPGQGTLPPPPLHSAIGNSDNSALEALPEEDAHADAIGSAEGPTLPHASAQTETETIQFVEGTSPAE
jgi:hypothetical protein